MVQAFGYKQEITELYDDLAHKSIEPYQKPWYRNGTIVIVPTNKVILFWNFLKTLVIAISVFTFAYNAAFLFKQRNSTIKLELFFDSV